MASLRPLNPRAVAWLGAAGLSVALATGCTTTAKMTEDVTHVVKSATEWAAPASPATQLVCVWQRRLAPLPDPTRDGALSPGIAGQMFLISADSNAAEVAGDLTVAVYDETVRPDGGQPRTPEVWHFTAAVLKNMATNDERFGKSYVLYLPWRPDWRDVTSVRILARYDAPGSPTLHSGEVRMALDLSSPDAPVWTDAAGKPAAPQAAGLDTRYVPDGAKIVQQAKATAAGAGVQPAGGVVPPPIIISRPAASSDQQ